MIKSLVAVFLAAILTENYVLSKFLGICPFLGVSKKIGTAVGMSLAVTAVMLIATAVTFPLYTLVLIPLELGYLQTIVFICLQWVGKPAFCSSTGLVFSPRGQGEILLAIDHV